jgi:uncharacterized protein YuzE
MLINNIKYEYNSMYDILYLKIKDCYDSYADEKNLGVVINYDYKTDEMVGIDIWSFKKKIENNTNINLPFNISLHKIYNLLS